MSRLPAAYLTPSEILWLLAGTGASVAGLFHPVMRPLALLFLVALTAGCFHLSRIRAAKMMAGPAVRHQAPGFQRGS